MYLTLIDPDFPNKLILFGDLFIDFFKNSIPTMFHGSMGILRVLTMQSVLF